MAAVTRYHSEEEYRAAVELRAREIWDDRERRIWGEGPHFAKQTWEQGTDLAKDTTRETARFELSMGTTVLG